MRIIGLETSLVAEMPLAACVLSRVPANARQMQANLPALAAIGHQSPWN